MAVDYKELLNEKVQDEYESFIAELKEMPSEKVIEHAYEKVIKEDLVWCYTKKMDSKKRKMV